MINIGNACQNQQFLTWCEQKFCGLYLTCETSLSRGGGPPGRGSRGAVRGAPSVRGARPPPGAAKPEPLMDRSGGYGYEEEYSYVSS